MNLDDLACTCHISNLKCRNERCQILIKARGLFKQEVIKILNPLFIKLKNEGFTRKESIRCLRREILHKNNRMLDLFDETANLHWDLND